MELDKTVVSDRQECNMKKIDKDKAVEFCKWFDYKQRKLESELSSEEDIEKQRMMFYYFIGKTFAKFDEMFKEDEYEIHPESEVTELIKRNMLE